MRRAGTVFLVLAALAFTPGAAHAAPKLKTLWNFCTAHFCTDGQHPTSGVIVDKLGDAYGATAGDLQGDPGGDPHKSVLFGVGPGIAIYNNNPQATFFRLVEFCSALNCTDGAQAASNIFGTIILSPTDPKLTITAYGTTVTGGAYNGGAIFMANLTTHQTIYSFCKTADSFSSCADGAQPGDIVTDSSGNIYGTTAGGGANAGYPSGPGVLYRLTKAGSYKVLHDFCSEASCIDGATPISRQLALYNNALYGTTYGGGKGYGVVFRFDLSTNHFDVLYTFCQKASCTDGAYAQAGVTFDTVHGILYGTTQYGGTTGYGVLYTIAKPTGTAAVAAASFKPLKSFCTSTACADGAYPGWAPAADGAGNLIGATYQGGATGTGTLYEYTPAAAKPYKLLYAFCSLASCTDGANPEGPVTLFPSGTGWKTIYGTTVNGGTNSNSGTVFTYTP